MGKVFIRMKCVLLSALFISSCSVKEIRDSCPSLLFLDFSEDDRRAPSPAALMITDGNQVVWEDTVDLVAAAEYGYSVYVPRTVVHMRLWSGDGGLAEGNGLSIPVGQPCPEVYMYDADLLMEGESNVAKVRLRKNHCVVSIVGDDGDVLPFVITVTGGVGGYDAMGVPVAGHFECPLRREDGIAVLPRQIDDSLLLHVSGEDSDVRTFALGQYIASSGYDWNSPDLEDITVTLDYALTEITLEVEGWEGVYVYDMVM